jgi:Protein of unknown function (DUF1501)
MRHTRRELLLKAGCGLGLVGLSSLLDSLGLRASEGINPLAAKPGHFPAKAKSVIWLFMNGGPSHIDTWDYKPELVKRDGQELPGLDRNTGFFTEEVGPLMKSPFAFAQHGQSGTWVSEIFPHLATQVDKMAFIHSCWTDSNNHAPALLKINSGMARMGFPSMGSWLTYGLGSASRDLPAFVVMYDTKGRGVPKGHSANWGAGFLPSIYQGTALRPTGVPIGDLVRPAELSDRSTCSPGSTTSRPRPPATTNGRRGSRALNSRTGCRPRRPRRSTSAPNRKRYATSTASTTRSARTTGGSA